MSKDGWGQDSLAGDATVEQAQEAEASLGWVKGDVNAANLEAEPNPQGSLCIETPVRTAHSPPPIAIHSKAKLREAGWTLAGLCSDFARLLGTDVTLAPTLSECQRSGWTLLHTLSSRQDLAPGSAPYHGYLCPARETAEHLWFSTQGQAPLGTQSEVLQGWEHDRLFILNINPTEEKTRS